MKSINKLIRNRIIHYLHSDRKIEEGWKENLVFLGAMALSNLNGAKAQTGQDVVQKNNIENTQEISASYSVMIGYLINMPKESPEQMAAIKEARIYFENLRDKKTPAPLSAAAKIVINYVIEETKKLDGKQLYSLAQTGMYIHSGQ